MKLAFYPQPFWRTLYLACVDLSIFHWLQYHCCVFFPAQTPNGIVSGRIFYQFFLVQACQFSLPVFPRPPIYRFATDLCIFNRYTTPTDKPKGGYLKCLLPPFAPRDREVVIILSLKVYVNLDVRCSVISNFPRYISAAQGIPRSIFVDGLFHSKIRMQTAQSDSRFVDLVRQFAYPQFDG